MNPDTLFGGGLSPILGGLLAPSEQDALRNSAMVNAGLAIAGGTHGLFPALQQGLQAGQQTYQQGAQNALGAAAVQSDLIDSMAKTAQQARVLAARREYPKLPNAQDPNTVRAWVDAVLPMAIAAGDKDVMSLIGQIRASLAPKDTAKSFEKVDLGDRVELRDPTTGKVLESMPKGTPPKAPEARAKRLVNVTNPATKTPEVAEYDPETGTFRFTGQKPAAFGSGSEMERKAMALMEMAAPMVPILDAADAPNRVTMLAREKRLGEVLTAEQQQNDIAGRMIMDAYLRLTTGAAYNAEEMRNSHTMLVPMPGDAPSTIALKRKVRQSLIRALKRAAGRAYDPNFAGAAALEGLDVIDADAPPPLSQILGTGGQ